MESILPVVNSKHLGVIMNNLVYLLKIPGLKDEYCLFVTFYPSFLFEKNKCKTSENNRNILIYRISSVFLYDFDRFLNK